MNNQTKKWWKESVVYQVYPRSFQDSNGDGIGDISGLISRLDYIKELGANVIWLNPVYQSPNDDMGYDISDYQAIMKEFGTMNDFDKLLNEAHTRGIKILMDLVVNHTSDEHKWFIESRSSKDNKFRDYYIWKPAKNNGVPNNWGSCFGGSAWEYDKTTDSYYLHLFSKKQPDLNWDNEKVRNDIFSMMRWWLDKGVDGFRMDVISMISKKPDFADGNTWGGEYGDFSEGCVNGPHVHEYLKEMNKEVLSKYDVMTVGETSCVTIELAKQYAGENTNELSMVFQFEHIDLGGGPFGKWTTNKVPLVELKKVLSKWQTELYGKAWNSLYWGNHDQSRAVSRFGDDTTDVNRILSAKMLAICLHLMQGTPYIFQGEELGMTNVSFSDLNQYKDIEIHNMYNQLVSSGKVSPEEMMTYIHARGRDNSRTPMQWNASKNAGFSDGTPWLQVNPNYKTINAETQIKDENSVFSCYKKLIQLRKQYELIVYGKYFLLLPEDTSLFVYTRNHEEKKLLVICNFSNSKIAKSFKFDDSTLNSGFKPNYNGNGKKLISNYMDSPNELNICDGNVELNLRPYEAMAFYFE